MNDQNNFLNNEFNKNKDELLNEKDTINMESAQKSEDLSALQDEEIKDADFYSAKTKEDAQPAEIPLTPLNAQPVSVSYQSTLEPPYKDPNFVPENRNKKKSAGSKVFMICLWVLLGVFGLTITGLCGYIAGSKVNLSEKIHSYLDENLEEKENQKENDKDQSSSQSNPLENGESLFDDEGKIVLNSYPDDIEDTAKYNTKTAYQKMSVSTVGIVCYSDNERKSVESQGTGIIITEDGYIATNSHVIGDSKGKYIIDVVLPDSKTVSALVVGFDTRTDLAVLKAKCDGLTPAEFADSELVSVGEDVIAIGNPGGIGFQNSLTKGIVSAKDRQLSLSTQVSYIQTDAAINPGNSGGPLCNLYGQVIGINSAKISSEDYEGMGFAIPSRTVREVVNDLIKQGYVSGRVKIGIVGSAVSESQASYYGLPYGILIDTVVEDGPCDGTDIRKDDILVSIDGKETHSFQQIYTLLSEYKQGDKVVLKLYRYSTDTYFEETVVLQQDVGQ